MSFGAAASGAVFSAEGLSALASLFAVPFSARRLTGSAFSVPRRGAGGGLGCGCGFTGVGILVVFCGTGKGFCAGFSSGSSTKLASIGAGVSVSPSGDVKRNPDAQMMIAQMMVASGTGHQNWTSFGLDFSVSMYYWCLTAIKKCCAPADRARNIACTTIPCGASLSADTTSFCSESSSNGLSVSASVSRVTDV